MPWAGMDADTYVLDLGRREVVHKPTGIALGIRNNAPHGMPPEPYPLRVPGAPGPVWLDINTTSNVARAMNMGVPHSIPGETQYFRRLHGSESSLDNIADMANMGALRWDGHLVHVVAVLYFIRTDPGRFWRGEPAFPDTLAFTARQLPRSVRGTVVRNPCAPRASAGCGSA